MRRHTPNSPHFNLMNQAVWEEIRLNLIHSFFCLSRGFNSPSSGEEEVIIFNLASGTVNPVCLIFLSLGISRVESLLCFEIVALVLKERWW